MEIMRKIAAKAQDNMNAGHVTIAFLGDSVTQGCFEVYIKADGNFETIFEKEHSYPVLLSKLFNVLYPTVPINMINAGISGDQTPGALKRIDRDVISHRPDLAVVCLGLNDVGLGLDNLENYTSALDAILKRLNEANIETIFMTPNMMNTGVSDHLKEEKLRRFAEAKMHQQLDGVMDAFVEGAKRVCVENGVRVCDCYAKWKLLHKNGANVTELLSNKINHPAREMNWLFAVSLAETMMQD